MFPKRLLFIVPCAAALVCGAGGAMAAKRDGRHAGHLPRVSTATYTVHARSHARVLRMAGVRGTRYAQSHHHSLMRGS
jgi:hypothetical protein